MQKVLITLVMAALVAPAFAQSPPPAKPTPGATAPQPAAMPKMSPQAKPATAGTMAPPAMPPHAALPPSQVPGAMPTSSARPDPFKPNPVAPPPTAATSLPDMAAIPPEPPKTPTMGVGGDGRTFIGVIGNNKALYKTGDGYVYEQISNP